MIVFSLLFFVGFAHAANDITTFFGEKNCDPKCTFPSQNLTTKTIEQFPQTCSTVCSELLINENCDLSEEQLTSLFSNMKKLIGSLTVISTKYTSGKFLAGLESIECVDGSEIMWIFNNQMVELGLVKLTTINCKGITVTGNKRLEKLNMPNIKNMTHPTNSNKKVGVSISSDLPSFCITTHEMYNFMIIDTAEVDYIFAKYCGPILGGNKLFGSIEIGPNSELEFMKSVETIFGSLVIRGTDLTNFDFLENLRYVAQLEHKPAILIENNSKLRNVTFPRLKKIRSHTTDVLKFDLNNREISTNSSLCYDLRKSLSLSDSAPTFDGFGCETLEFMEKQVKDKDKYAGSLSFVIPLIPAVMFMFLKFTDYLQLTNYNIKEPINGCTQLFGNVEIGINFDNESMKSVETIFGNLVINETDLTSLECFENLKYVAELGNNPAILIESNQKLTNFTFPKLRRLHSNANEIMSFKSNPFTFVNFTLCFEIRKSLDLRGLAPTFDGFSCEYHKMDAESIRARELIIKVENSSASGWSFLMIVFSAIFLVWI